MDKRIKTIVRILVENFYASNAHFTDAELIVYLYVNEEIRAKDMLKLMKIKRQQRHRRMRKLESLGLIERVPDKKDIHSCIYRLTYLGTEVGYHLHNRREFRYMKFRIPPAEKEFMDSRKMRTRPVPTRESIYEAVERKGTTVDEYEEFIDFDEEEDFNLDEFLDDLEQKVRGRRK